MFMPRALELATYAIKNCRPNPAVGAVIVKNGEIIGEGYTQEAGKDHAEITAIKNALANADESEGANAGENERVGGILAGAELYVTLEPCSHFGRTPPCTDAIIESGIKKTHYGFLDPNPQVAGKGIAKLNEAGIETICNSIAGRESQSHGKIADFYESYSWFVKRKTPFVTLKIAQTLDGFIANADKSPVKITGEESQKKLHELRSWCDAVVIGGGTLRADNPQLTVRKVKGANPQKVVFSKSAPTSLIAAGIINPRHSFSENWFSMLAFFAKKGMHHILVEAGATLAKNIFSIAAQSTKSETLPFHKFLLWTSPLRLGKGLEWNTAPASVIAGLTHNFSPSKTYMQGKDFCQEWTARAYP